MPQFSQMQKTPGKYYFASTLIVFQKQYKKKKSGSCILLEKLLLLDSSLKGTHTYTLYLDYKAALEKEHALYTHCYYPWFYSASPHSKNASKGTASAVAHKSCPHFQRYSLAIKVATQTASSTGDSTLGLFFLVIFQSWFKHHLSIFNKKAIVSYIWCICQRPGRPTAKVCQLVASTVPPHLPPLRGLHLSHVSINRQVSTYSLHLHKVPEHFFLTLEMPEGKESESWHTTFKKLLTPNEQYIFDRAYTCVCVNIFRIKT